MRRLKANLYSTYNFAYSVGYFVNNGKTAVNKYMKYSLWLIPKNMNRTLLLGVNLYSFIGKDELGIKYSSHDKW